MLKILESLNSLGAFDRTVDRLKYNFQGSSKKPRKLFAKTGQGDIEMIKIHIRRKVPEDKQEELNSLINDLRAITTGKQGYIGGETLKRIDKPGESLVVTKWQSLFYWTQWFDSKERFEIQNKIDQLLAEETQYEIYEYD